MDKENTKKQLSTCSEYELLTVKIELWLIVRVLSLSYIVSQQEM